MSARGQEWARRFAAFGSNGQSPDDLGRRLKKLRRDLDRDEAAAIVDQARARRSLEGRHPDAARLFVTSTGVRQASSYLAAEWRARRFDVHASVADLTCGLGLDAIELARRGVLFRADSSSTRDSSASSTSSTTPLIVSDMSRARLILARANMTVVGDDGLDDERLAATAFVHARAPETVPQVDFVFCDPDRRRGERRIVDPDDASPPLRPLLAALRDRGVAGAGVKLSPLADVDALTELGEVELISIAGELKEIVLWTGDLATSLGARRISRPDHCENYDDGREDDGVAADKLGDIVHHDNDARDTDETRGTTLVGRSRARPASVVENVDDVCYLFDPDPALVRSGLLGVEARRHDLQSLDADIAYLVGPTEIAHPFLTSYEILAVLPARPRDVKSYLREHGLGRLVASRRGFRIPPDEFLRQVTNSGDGSAHLHLTKHAGRPIVVVTRRRQ